MNIADFIIARVREDEQANSARNEPEAWCDRSAGTHYEHARVEAECAAKRALVEPHHEEFGTCVTCVDRDADGERFRVDYPCRELRILASIYSTHDDYDLAWSN